MLHREAASIQPMGSSQLWVYAHEYGHGLPYHDLILVFLRWFGSLLDVGGDH